MKGKTVSLCDKLNSISVETLGMLQNLRQNHEKNGHNSKLKRKIAWFGIFIIFNLIMKLNCWENCKNYWTMGILKYITNVETTHTCSMGYS